RRTCWKRPSGPRITTWARFRRPPEGRPPSPPTAGPMWAPAAGWAGGPAPPWPFGGGGAPPPPPGPAPARGRVGAPGPRARRPSDRVVEPDVAHTADTGLHTLDVRQDDLGRHAQLDTEHQLVALAAGLDLLGRKLGLRGDKAGLRSCRVFGCDVEDDAGVGT